MRHFMSAISIRVDGPDQAGEARRSAALMSKELRLDEGTAARVALVVTECANNLWKHGGGGDVVLIPLDSETPSMEILALDKGPGMASISGCFQDGYSTAGSPGTGLGAVQRTASEWDIYSVEGKGTALLARIRLHQRSQPQFPAERLNVGALVVPMPGQIACGDGYAVHQTADFATILVVDGLGHGPQAADCAVAAVDAFAEAHDQCLAEIMARIHGALRATRGAAVGLARFMYQRREIQFAGIGNIAGVVYDRDKSRQMVSLPGIVGHDSRHVREFTYPWEPGEMALLYSDGIASHWSLPSYEGLMFRDPSLVAGVLYRDHNRGRDDATILAVRERAA
jgi:anti-sigma regulatory factor (Ser/Thr protein kinase)